MHTVSLVGDGVVCWQRAGLPPTAHAQHSLQGKLLLGKRAGLLFGRSGLAHRTTI